MCWVEIPDGGHSALNAVIGCTRLLRQAGISAAAVDASNTGDAQHPVWAQVVGVVAPTRNVSIDLVARPGIFVPLAQTQGYVNFVAKRIAARPQSPGQILVDDGNSGRGRCIGFQHEASAQQTNSHGFEIVRGNRVEIGAHA